MSDYNKDSWIVSLVWGRIGASVLALVAFGLGMAGYQMDMDQQKMVFDVIASIFAGGAGILSIVSKVRESKKVK